MPKKPTKTEKIFPGGRNKPAIGKILKINLDMGDNLA